MTVAFTSAIRPSLLGMLLVDRLNFLSGVMRWFGVVFSFASGIANGVTLDRSCIEGVERAELPPPLLF